MLNKINVQIIPIANFIDNISLLGPTEKTKIIIPKRKNKKILKISERFLNVTRNSLFNKAKNRVYITHYFLNLLYLTYELLEQYEM